MASESEPIRARGIIVKNMTRDLSTLVAPVPPTGPGIRVYLFGRIPRAVCLEIYLLCLVLNPPATILEKKLVLNLRLTLCALKTLLLIV